MKPTKTLSDRPILVTGAGGYVGSHLAALGRPNVLLSRRTDADLFELIEQVDQIRPRAVLHLAAVSRIDVCESDPDRARAVNVEATVRLAEAAAKGGARFVFVSTDQIFDGALGLYKEADSPAPLSLYGETKAQAEQELRRLSPGNLLITRLNLVVGRGVKGKPSGTDAMLEAAQAGRPTRLFHDEFRSPIHVKDAAQSLLMLADHEIEGTLHLGGPERLSRLAIGTQFLKAARLSESSIESVSLATYQGPPRAADTSFDNHRLLNEVGPVVRPLSLALREEF